MSGPALAHRCCQIPSLSQNEVRQLVLRGLTVCLLCTSGVETKTHIPMQPWIGHEFFFWMVCRNHLISDVNGLRTKTILNLRGAHDPLSQ